VEIDRQAIERHDFPLSRRGYDTASVDEHLHNLAARFDELTRAHAGVPPTLAAAAGTQVQSIIATAESAAADIRREATADAARTREEAVAAARTQVAAVSAAATKLLERVTGLDETLRDVVAKTHAAASQLVRELDVLETDAGELSRAAGEQREERAEQAPAQPRFPIPTEVPGAERVHANPLAATPDRPLTAGAPAPAPSPQPSEDDVSAPAENGDADSARLVALNMALSGESRADTERYLAENFQLADPLKLVDEVYSAIDA